MSIMLRGVAVVACVGVILSGAADAGAQPPVLSADSELGPYVVQATLTPGGGTDDRFGSRGVIFVNDTVLVPGTGAVYVFERTPGTDVWQERGPLTPPAGVTDDVFGNRVIFVNDTVLVSGTGVVYVFERTPGTDVWEDSVPLTPTAPVEGFGTSSVAFDGQRAIVGVHGGAVLFRRTGPGAWHQVAVLTDPGLDPDSTPGVGIHGDTVIVQRTSTFAFSRRDSQPESWEMSLVVTELPDWGGTPNQAQFVTLHDDTLIFSVSPARISDPSNSNRLWFFVRDAGGSGQWEAVQSLSLGFFGRILALDDSRVVVGGGEASHGYARVLRLNREVNRWESAGTLQVQGPVPGSGSFDVGQPVAGSISGDIIVLRTWYPPNSNYRVQIFASNQGGRNAWGRVGLLLPSQRLPQSGSLTWTISGDTAAIVGPPEQAVLMLASDIDRDGLRDGIDACPRDPQNNVAGGCARDSSAYLVLDDLISMGDVTTETVGDEFHITATFTNSSESAIGNPFFEVTELTEGNVLLNSDAGSAATGATLSPDVGDGIWSPGEPTTVTFVIGLASSEPFQFYVSVKGEPTQ
jgi:hypothetical protein